MKLYPVNELFFLKRIDKTKVRKMITESLDGSDLNFFVRRPEEYKFYSVNDSDLFDYQRGVRWKFKNYANEISITKELIDSDFLKLDSHHLKLLLENDFVNVNWFDGCCVIDKSKKQFMNESTGYVVKQTHVEKKFVFLPFLNNEKLTLRSVSPIKVNIEDLYFYFEYEKNDSLEFLKDWFFIFEEIPSSVRSKVKKMPKVDGAQFPRLRYLLDANINYWTEYKFKDQIIIKKSEFQYDIHFDRLSTIFSSEFDERDKQIKRDIYDIDLKTKKFILEKFQAENLDNGVALGDRCAGSAAEFCKPSFQFYYGGKLKRTSDEYLPVRLWIIFQAANFIWGDIRRDDYLTHPSNSLVADFFYSLDERVDTRKISSEALELRDAFLKKYPEIYYYPNEIFTKVESSFAATLVRPKWAYAKHKGKK